MQANQELSLHSYCLEDKIDESDAKISFEFTEKLMIEDSRPDFEYERENEDDEEEETEDDDDDDDDDDEEFSFASVTDDVSPIAADKVFQDGQIRPVYPLFNQDLLLGEDVSANRLPTRPPVDKVFIESPRCPSNASESDEIEGVAAGPYCTWSKESAPEFGKKSNSTGFSKLWRFKEKMNRSHSDGRDAFVFLNNSTPSSSKREEKSVAKADASSEKKSSAGDGSSQSKTTGKVKVNSTDGKAKSKKGGKKKVTSLSPHEVYLRSKLTEEDRRRSYLPYRPELMGFFTNVHGGGLSRNVHPF